MPKFYLMSLFLSVLHFLVVTTTKFQALSEENFVNKRLVLFCFVLSKHSFNVHSHCFSADWPFILHNLHMNHEQVLIFLLHRFHQSLLVIESILLYGIKPTSINNHQKPAASPKNKATTEENFSTLLTSGLYAFINW